MADNQAQLGLCIRQRTEMEKERELKEKKSRSGWYPRRLTCCAANRREREKRCVLVAVHGGQGRGWKLRKGLSRIF
jgi:hypothetical protein